MSNFLGSPQEALLAFYVGIDQINSSSLTSLVSISEIRFSFGKLEFETDRLGKAYAKDGIVLGPDDQAIFIHIPRTGERLLPEDVDTSLRRAYAERMKAGLPLGVALGVWVYRQ